MTQPQQLDPAKVGQTGQIIVGALISGLVCFGGITLANQQPPNGQSMLTMIGAGLAGINLLLWIVVPGMVARAYLKDLASADEIEQQSRLAQTYLTKKIVGAAILEGAGFFNGVCYLIERNPISLGVFGGLIALLVLMMPSQGQFESWAEEMKRELS